MAKRIMIDAGIREAALTAPAGQLSCTECGDLITDHQWIEVDADAVIIACDRARVSSAKAVTWLMAVREQGIGRANEMFPPEPQFEADLTCGDSVSLIRRPAIGSYRHCIHCEGRRRVTAVRGYAQSA